MSKTNLIGRQIIVVDVNMHGGDGSIAKFFEIKDDELYENINEERFYGEQNNLYNIYEKVINKVYFERNPIIFIDEPKAHMLAKKIKDTYLGLIEVINIEISQTVKYHHLTTLLHNNKIIIYRQEHLGEHEPLFTIKMPYYDPLEYVEPPLIYKPKKKEKLKWMT